MIRFAIWSAVSSKPQAAPEKVSLEAQEKACRAAGQSEGWVEMGIYQVPGASRSFYVNLSDAERDIPALKQMLNDARNDAWDVLVIYTYDRLGDLDQMIRQTLRFYGKQIYSVTQPNPIQPPDEFDPLSETEAILGDVHRITQRFRINDLRRKRRSAMPKRILEKGLPASRIPFGYRKPHGQEFNPDAIPEQNPIQAAIVIRIKDLFLAGKSLWQIADAQSTDGAIAPRGGRRWTDVMVHHILTNPFYSGTVFYGGERRVFDPRSRKVTFVQNPPSRVIRGKGAHVALWDQATQRRIEEEFARRRIHYTGVRTHRLSNLLYCGTCGARMYVGYGGHYPEPYRFWKCKDDRRHITIKDAELLPRVAEELVRQLQDTKHIELPKQEYKGPTLRKSLAELQTRRSRLNEAYLSGAMSLQDFSHLGAELEIQIYAAEQELAQQAHAAQNLKERIQAIQALTKVIADAPDYLMKGPEQEVNNELRDVLERIIVSPDKIEFKIRIAG